MGPISTTVWAQMDSNHRRWKPADLQSAPFGHSGICPTLFGFKISMFRMYLFTSLSCGDSHRIQTYNLLIRSQMLYSVELASHDFRGQNMIACRLSFMPLLDKNMIACRLSFMPLSDKNMIACRLSFMPLSWALTDSNRRPSACKADALNQLS